MKNLVCVSVPTVQSSCILCNIQQVAGFDKEEECIELK